MEMEINISEIISKLKSTAVSVGDKAAKAGKDFVSTTKTNIRIMELNSQIDAEYKNAGKLLYAVHNGEEISPEAIDEVLEIIDGKKAELDELNSAIAKAKLAYTCPVCGKNVGKTAAFCSACGAKIERPEAENTEEPCEEAPACEEKEEEPCCCEEAEECCCCEGSEEKCCCEEDEKSECRCEETEKPDCCGCSEEKTEE